MKESKRESRREARSGKSRSGPETWAKTTGAKRRDCDGKQQSQWTSRAHGKGEWAE